MSAFVKIYPPIEQRDDMELIDIARVSATDWRPEIVAMAEKELEKRGVTLERQQEIIDDYHRFAEYVEAGETARKEWNRQ